MLDNGKPCSAYCKRIVNVSHPHKKSNDGHKKFQLFVDCTQSHSFLQFSGHCGSKKLICELCLIVQAVALTSGMTMPLVATKRQGVDMCGASHSLAGELLRSTCRARACAQCLDNGAPRPGSSLQLGSVGFVSSAKLYCAFHVCLTTIDTAANGPCSAFAAW